MWLSVSRTFASGFHWNWKSPRLEKKRNRKKSTYLKGTKIFSIPLNSQLHNFKAQLFFHLIKNKSFFFIRFWLCVLWRGNCFFLLLILFFLSGDFSSALSLTLRHFLISYSPRLKTIFLALPTIWVLVSKKAVRSKLDRIKLW